MKHKPIIGLDDAFGSRAKALRNMQGKLLELFEAAGYEEVIPPILERPDALKSGAGRFLADQTVVFSDPAGAGTLAIRSDMTPQIARIAATRLQAEAVLKLCYSGTVMLARPDVRGGSRQQWQTGVECLGVAGAAGDIEVLHLAARSMLAAGFNKPVLQVGHIGLLKALVAGCSTPLEKWTALLARRSPDDLLEITRNEPLAQDRVDALVALARGRGDQHWIAENVGKFGADFDQAANELLELVQQVGERVEGDVSLYADAAVMPRFLYHSGILFAGYAAGASQALLYGGRYDAMMKAHGRDMPATGFSCDLWALIDEV
ncbi:ATP phosphoribosyltransferase regulatory subunit [Mariprofundus ferrinatatus]|uniref:ATP phosphoribosyltransferase regulatory subunit n=1 Tax=Mariprofundus ferrinatatus TaxID=1921087 RepID=A0A2K8LCK6_9PROT|nr:ATP phosphoribosyltransferase regulatory subunit [Mariprofundus ferrinatatus]ATX82026.1 ATP phosphoribosyltransferase regulatory subunit [Mariprofundus ferrinatatus]